MTCSQLLAHISSVCILNEGGISAVKALGTGVHIKKDDCLSPLPVSNGPIEKVIIGWTDFETGPGPPMGLDPCTPHPTHTLNFIIGQNPQNGPT